MPGRTCQAASPRTLLDTMACDAFHGPNALPNGPNPKTSQNAANRVLRARTPPRKPLRRDTRDFSTLAIADFSEIWQTKRTVPRDLTEESVSSARIANGRVSPPRTVPDAADVDARRAPAPDPDRSPRSHSGRVIRDRPPASAAPLRSLAQKKRPGPRQKSRPLRRKQRNGF